MIFLKYYLQILVPLLACLVGYELLVTPNVQPAKSIKPSRWVNQHNPTGQGAQWWQAYFPEGSWQRQSPLVIEQDQFILLYQKREQLTDTRWRFSPLTIVINSKNQSDSNSSGQKENQRAIFIDNPKGAEIQFKSAFDWTLGHPPPVAQGQLSGQIEIYSPPDPKTNQGELRILAEDVRIDKRQVWTDKQISMKLGGSSVQGRYLSIFMDQDLLSESTAGATSKSQSPFAGLDYLQLFYVDQVQLELQNGGLWPTDPSGPDRTAKAYAKLDCRGRFQFQFHQSQATFMDGVHLEHVVEGKPIDTFDCNELRFNVGWNSNQDQTAWKLDRLEAIGLPGRDPNDQSRWVRLNAPGMQAEAHGQHLVMDLVHGMVSLSNVLPGSAPKNSSRVLLKRGNMQITSPNIQYQNPEALSNAQESKFTRLGWVIADGIGQAQVESEEGEIWNLRWSKRLSIRPHENRDLISIDGGANISSSLRGRFVAEKLHLWVLPVDESIAAKLAPYYPDGKLPAFIPDSIAADGQVIVNAPELNAQVESMAIRFRHLDPQEAHRAGYSISEPGAKPNAPKGPSTGPSSILSPPNLATPALQNPASNTQLNPPGNSLANASPTTPLGNRPAPPSNPPSTPPNAPISITGKTLQADIVRIGNESIVENLTLEGNFTLLREFLSAESPWPLTATGDKLVIQSESSDRSNVYLVGQPAKISVGSGWVVAKELQLSQNDQLFWINQPGELVLPHEALSQEPNDGSWNWRSAPRIQWGERMTFDGRNARFGGGVIMDCRLQTDASTLWHLLANARTLTLDMSQRVPFQLPTGSGKNPKPAIRPEVQTVRLDGDVDIKAVQTDLAGVRRSAENFILPRLEFQVPSRTWVGFGPGQLWSRRFANTSSLATGILQPGNLQPGNPATPSPNPNPSPETLQCLHLTFVGRMEGSVPQRIVSLYDKVAALLGPIASWDDQLDVRNSERLAPQQSRLICDQLNLFDASSLSYNQGAALRPKGAFELDALGAAQLTSRTESGDVVVDASRIGYAAADDAVRIEGTVQRPATIRRLTGSNPSAPGQSDAGQSIQVSSASMRLRTGQINAQIRKIEGAFPMNMQPGSPQPGSNQPNSNQPSNSPMGASAPNSSSTLPSARDYNPLNPRGSRPR